jgi:hypothetical protein
MFNTNEDIRGHFSHRYFVADIANDGDDRKTFEVCKSMLRCVSSNVFVRNLKIFELRSIFVHRLDFFLGLLVKVLLSSVIITNPFTGEVFCVCHYTCQIIGRGRRDRTWV